MWPRRRIDSPDVHEAQDAVTRVSLLDLHDTPVSVDVIDYDLTLWCKIRREFIHDVIWTDWSRCPDNPIAHGSTLPCETDVTVRAPAYEERRERGDRNDEMPARIRRVKRFQWTFVLVDVGRSKA